MNHVETDRRLELVKSIRMQNLQNREKCQERERLLYGNTDIRPESKAPCETPKRFSSFRIRFILSILLFCLFLFLDMNQIAVFGITTNDIFSIITDSMEINLQLPVNLFDL